MARPAIVDYMRIGEEAEDIENAPIAGKTIQKTADEGLLLVGPLVVVVIAGLGRSIVTELLAVAYLVVFLGYVSYRGVVHLSQD